MHAKDFSTKPSAKDEVLSRDVAKSGYVSTETAKCTYFAASSAAVKLEPYGTFIVHCTETLRWERVGVLGTYTLYNDKKACKHCINDFRMLEVF